MKNDYAELVRSLNRLFWTMTALAAAFLGLGYLLHRTEATISSSLGSLRVWGIFLMTLSAILGIALPILLRTMFNKQAVTAKQVALADFVAYQKRLAVIPICAAYVASVAYILAVPGFYLYGSVLCGLYGIYSALPQERKLKGEMRYYGLMKK